MEKVRDYWEPIVGKDRNGDPVLLDSHGVKTLQLRCDCGHEWTVPKVDFPGRRKLRSCGRPQCPYTPQERPSKRLPGQEGVSKTVYLSHDNLEWLWARKEKHGISISKTVDSLISRARADELISNS